MKYFILLLLLTLQTDLLLQDPGIYYIEFHKIPTVADLQKVKKTYQLHSIYPFYKRSGEYWQRYYEVKTYQAVDTNNNVMPNLIARLEAPAKGYSFSIEPNNSDVALSEDTFIRYQWALENQGQKLYRPTDDIHPQLVYSADGLDIEWKRLQELLKNKNLKKPIVAIIDSGLSVTHEEISHALYKNEAECRDGRIVVNTNEDKDGNGFAGDCVGWNFTTENQRRRNDVSDDIGHGTHIAGIISAKTNDVGISGLWDQIQILPLKVYSNSQERDQAPFVQRVAKAILYAVDRKVDVINLSLGWPLVLDLPVVRNAIDEANKANIIIVAGAGNDGHSAKVLPCSYEQVICVGATGLDGSLPNFTNYGGQVDIMAPGEAILSIYPPLLMSKNFGLRKYEVMNGTSQASPHVSAAVAILKAYYPNIHRDEIIARLRLGARQDITWKDKFAASGLLQVAKSIEQNKQPFVAPVFKNIDMIVVNPSSQYIEIDLPIKNYWQDTADIHVEVESDQIDFQKSIFTIPFLIIGQQQTLKLFGSLKNLDSDYLINFKVHVTYNAKKITYQHEAFLTTSSKTANYTDIAVASELMIQSVNDYGLKNQNAEFFTQEKVEGGLLIKILALDDQALRPKGSLFIPNAVDLYRFIGVSRVDLNHDQVPDYFITAVVVEGDETRIEHHSLDINMRPLFGKQSVWRFNYEGSTIHQGSMQFADFQSPTLGKVRVPVYFEKGQTVPYLDQNPDPFEPFYLKDRGLYVLHPVETHEGITLQTRLLNSYERLNTLSAKYQLRFNEEITFLHYDVNAHGNIATIVAAGLATNLKYYYIEYSATDFSIVEDRPLHLANADLRFQNTRRVNEDIIAFFAIYRNNHAQLTLIDTKKNSLNSYTIESEDLRNGIISLQAVNLNASGVQAFVETVDSLYLFSFAKDGGFTKQSTPIHRFSYLPGQMFSDLLFPLYLEDDHHGIYVDSSTINSRNVHLWVAKNGVLMAPIKYSVQLENNCRALNPRKLKATDVGPSYLFLCQGEKGPYLRQTPLSIGP